MKNILLITFLFCLSQYGCTINQDKNPKKSLIPTNGLVAWYPFNGNANDESGNGNNGIVNGATLTTDRFKEKTKAYSFTSTNCATRIDADVKTNAIISGLTISIWFQKSGKGCISPRILEFWPGSNGAGLLQLNWAEPEKIIRVAHILDNKNEYIFQFPAGDEMLNKWHHLVYTNDGSNGKLYFNGELKNTRSVSGKPKLALDLAIGRMNHPEFDAFQGDIDDLGIWDRVLTATEVSKIFKGEKF